MIPNDNLFIVTSAIKPVIGVFNQSDRLSQTLDTLHNLRKKVPDAIICLADCSVTPLNVDEVNLLSSYCNIFMDMSQEPNTYEFSKRGMKSHAENALLFSVLAQFKHNPQLQPVLARVKRIFKYSARSKLDKEFDISHYENLFGKYVFKTRIPSWMNDKDYLFITRLFSLCPSLIDDYLMVIQKNMPLLDKMDTEHAHYVNIQKKYLIEFDKLHCSGILAGNGQTEYY